MTEAYEQWVQKVHAQPIDTRFDGRTYEADLDGKRLTGQLGRVYTVMSDGAWHTLPELAQRTTSMEASVSARLRDLRKSRFGAYTVERRRVAGGLWQYRLVSK